MIATLTSMLRDDSGASMVEYGLLLALIAMAALIAVKGVGTGLTALFNNVAGSL
jgi:pilus assembly protein Flp/PilA